MVGTAYSIVGDPKESYTLYINQIGDMPRPSRSYDFGGGPKSWGIWKSIDNGDAWVQICNTDIFAKHISQSGVIDPDNNKIIYWTAADGGIQKSVDGGYSWLEISTGLDKGNIERYWHMNDMELDHNSPPEKRRIYYPTSLGLYYMDEPDSGWNLMEGGLPNGSCNDVEVCDGGIVYAVIDDKGLFRSEDSGKTWHLLENGIDSKFPYLIAVTDSRPDIIYVTTKLKKGYPRISSGIYGSQDGGDSFRLLTHGRHNSEYNWVDDYRHGDAVRSRTLYIDPNDPFTVYLDYEKKTHDGGKTWQNFGMKEVRRDRWTGTGLTLLTDYRVVFDPNRPNKVWLGFSDTGLMLSEDNGETLVNIQEFHRGEINQAAYWRDKLVHASGGCHSMTVDPDLSTTIYTTISGKDGNHRLNVGGIIFKSVDDGWNWTPIYEKHGLDDGVIRSIIIDPSSPIHNRTVYAASYGNGVYKSIDDGRSFNKITPDDLFRGNTRLMWMEMAPSDPKTLYLAVGGSYGIRPITQLPTMVYYPSLESEQYGGVFKTTDGGETWTKCNSTREIPSVTDIAVHPFDKNIVYAAAFSEDFLVPENSGHQEWKQGGIFRSSDGGKNWKKIFSPPIEEIMGKGEVQGICINPVAPEIIYAAVRNYGIYRTLNEGKTWEMVGKASMDRRQRTYHSIDLNPHNPAEVWVALFGNAFVKGIDYEAQKLMENKFSRSNFVRNPGFEQVDKAEHPLHWNIEQPPAPKGEVSVFSLSFKQVKDGKNAVRFQLTKAYFDEPCPWPGYREQIRLEEEGELPLQFSKPDAWWPCGLTNTWIYQKINPYFTSLMRGHRVIIEMDVFIAGYPKEIRHGWKSEEVLRKAPQVYLSEARDYNLHYVVADAWIEDAVPVDKAPLSQIEGDWIHVKAIGRVSEDAQSLRVTVSGVGLYSDPMDIYVDNVRLGLVK